MPNAVQRAYQKRGEKKMTLEDYRIMSEARLLAAAVLLVYLTIGRK